MRAKLGCVLRVAVCVGLWAGADAASAQNLIVDNATVQITPATARRYDHICVINNGVVTVTPYAGGDASLEGNLELIAGSIYVDASSRIVARGAGYQPRKCYHGDGPNDTAGGRGGCAVWDSGGGGAHFGRGGRGTIDAPTEFPRDYEENCDDCADGTCSHTFDIGDDSCDNAPRVACGAMVAGCTDARDGGRFCREGPSVAGISFWHDIYAPDFGAAGGDKGCLDDHGFDPVTGGAGGGRVVLVGLSERTAVVTSPCGVNLPRGSVRIDGDIDASGKRGCGIGNDSGGGGAGGTVLIVGQTVRIGASSSIAAAGGLGGDTRSAAIGQPDYLDCAGAQSSGTCDDCGGGGGGGIISVLSVNSEIDAAAQFDVGGADGGTCDICRGEAGGGAGELQIDGAYVGEFCDGYDNDFDGMTDEMLGTQACGLGNCQQSIAACAAGEPVTCDPMVTADATCSEDPTGARPRIAVVLDTSASMLLSLDGRPTFGDGSVDHPGLDLDGDGEANDSRLHLARSALAQVLSAYPEIDFALARYHQDQAAARNCQTASWFECQELVASYDDPTGNTGPTVCQVDLGSAGMITVQRDPQSPEECINYAGSCGPPRRGADVLSGFGMHVRDMVRWLDGRETAFRSAATPGNVCNHAGDGDCEVRGSGPTPLAGSLQAIEDYVVPIRTTDAAADCRSYTTILVTDGAESCNGDPAAAAQRLHDMFDIDVHVVAVSVLPDEEMSLNAIAAAGGTGTAIFVNAPEDLVPALTSIIGGSIRLETCNNLDDDCDTAIDEGLPKYCDKPSGLPEAELCEDPGESVCDGEDDDCDGSIDEGVLNACGQCGELPDESCDAVDNDCDGRIDEGTGGGVCGADEGEGQCQAGTLRCVGGALECRGEVAAEPETCDCQDDDCDGTVDEDPDGALCAEGRCIGCACVTFCEVTDEFEPRCPGDLDPEFQPSGECLCVDDMCDDVACAAMTLERDAELACAPDDARVAECECRAGACVARCDGMICASGQVCDPRDGRCVEDSCRGLGCPQGELCDALEAECVDDACAAVTCAPAQVCRGGECEASCAGVRCEPGARCRGGRCEDDPCAGARCALGEVCSPESGACIVDPCSLVSCPSGTTCAVPSGECERDACWDVRCPGGELCVEGECRRGGNAGPVAPPDDTGAEAFVLATGGGGCSCRVAKGRAAHGWLAAVLLGGVGLARRRCHRARAARRVGARLPAALRVLPLALVLALPLALSGCKVNAFCLDCDGDEMSGGAGEGDAGRGDGGTSTAGHGGGGGAGDSGSSGDTDGGMPPRCEPAAEVCNASDDDCDFRVDEEVEAEQNDCDQLGVCAGTQPTCVGGEFECRYPAAREDDETRCDGEDEDCDGRLDESFAELGSACSVGTGACETEGEYACDASGAGLRCAIGDMPSPVDETCDGLDNDCDGLTDEPKSQSGNHASYVQDALTQLGSSLWMYTYEASRPDATDGEAGQSAGRACSRSGVLPWTAVSFASASSACDAAGLRLCTAGEWLGACEGSAAAQYPYGDDYAEDSCNGADHDVDSAAASIQNALRPAGSLSGCVSADGVFDLSGNAKEWTDDARGSAGGQPIYVVRGGSYDSPQYGLTCQTELSQAIATTVLPTLGFRCCTNVEP